MPENNVGLQAVTSHIKTGNPGIVSSFFVVFKFAFDIAISLLLLPALFFVCLITMILNPTLNPGKLFYTQDRVGKDTNVFKIYKLRTMSGNIENTKFATDETARITALGKFMRDIHVDELPQILNVLLGDMSLIGPRPEQIEFFKEYAKNIQGFDLRQSIRPGISGLAQLRYGYTDCPVGARQKLKWDITYINQLGFAQEADILLQTTRYVFQRIMKALIQLKKNLWKQLT
ncbi:MAG: sugar transferase [Rhodobacterales bacterium]